MGRGAPKGNQFAKGHDGTAAGRKSFRDETVITAVINKAWEWLDNNWERFDDRQKMEVATRICQRTIPEFKEHGGNVVFQIVDKIKELN